MDVSEATRRQRAGRASLVEKLLVQDQAQVSIRRDLGSCILKIVYLKKLKPLQKL